MATMTKIMEKLAPIWDTWRNYFSGRRLKRHRPVVDAATLRWFLDTRANHVAQTSLYGYLRARTGVRFPELFHDDAFVGSINIAKWQLWLACLADLGAYTGGLVFRRGRSRPGQIDRLMTTAIDDILRENGVPEDAGPEFGKEAARVKARFRDIDWASVDDDTVFCDSPAALVRWAPIIDELKQLDEEIVTNSVRFRWNEVRRDLRELLDADSLLDSAGKPSTESDVR